MRHSFLDILACPVSGAPLTLKAFTEVEAPMLGLYCPAPRDGDIERNQTREVVSGLLVTEDDRWYPLINGIPEILPDRLRDWNRDIEFAESLPDGVLTDAMRAPVAARFWSRACTRSS